MRRICCSPFWDARQPGPPLVLKADSMGKLGSSDVTSTVAICPRSIQCEPDPGLTIAWSELTILFRTLLFSLKQEAGEPNVNVGCSRAQPMVAPDCAAPLLRLEASHQVRSQIDYRARHRVRMRDDGCVLREEVPPSSFRVRAWDHLRADGITDGVQSEGAL